MEQAPATNKLGHIKRSLMWSWRFSCRLAICFIIFSFYQVLFFRFFDPITTPKIVSNFWENLWLVKEQKMPDYDWVDFEEVSPYVFLAVMTSEDQRFLTHHGFDIEAIQKAIQNNKKGKRIKGASTISQQVSKNMFLWPGRNFIRKGLEAYYTLLIEALWSKKRILEVYINIAELGPDTYGIGAASGKFLKKAPIKLTKQEAALAAAVLPNPIKYSMKKPSPYVLRRRSQIASRMWHVGNKKLIESL